VNNKMTSSYGVDVKAGLKDLAMVRHDPTIRMTCSPLGNVPGERTCVVGGAVSWKGAKGDDFINKAPTAVVDGLRQAKAIAAQCENLKGTVIYGGKVQTARSVCMMKKAGK